MLFLPMPHEVQEKPGEFQIRWNTSVILSDRTAPGALLWARMLRQEVLDASGLDLQIFREACIWMKILRCRRNAMS